MPTNDVPIMLERHKKYYESAWTKDKTRYIYRLCKGPGLICRALSVTNDQNGKLLEQPPFKLRIGKNTANVVSGPRINVEDRIEKNLEKIDQTLKDRASWPNIRRTLKDRAVERHWRFADYNSREFLSEQNYPLYQRLL